MEGGGGRNRCLFASSRVELVPHTQKKTMFYSNLSCPPRPSSGSHGAKMRIVHPNSTAAEGRKQTPVFSHAAVT